MSTFVRVAEVWIPDAQGYLLEFGGGLYGQAPEFGMRSRAMCFGRGEGLPGRVWEEGRPVVMKDLRPGYFQRAAAAQAAGLTCAVAFPVCFDDRLKAVVVLFCGDTAAQSGAIEIWRNDPRVTTDLTLLDGVYGGADTAFEQASRDTSMPRGSGLPGLAWQRQGAVLLDGLTESTRFLRAEAAGESGMRTGLALPCPVPGNDNIVLTFLSAPDTPIATRIECWTAGADGQSLVLGQQLGTPSGKEPHPAILEAFATGVPRVSGHGVLLPKGGHLPSPSASTEGAPAALIAIPIVVDGAVAEAVALYF